MDQDTVELLERRLAERVEARVRGRLFAFYLAVGSVILGILGYISYDVISNMKQGAIDFAKDHAEEQTRSVVAPVVEQARAAVADAAKEAQRVAAALDILEDYQSRREAALLSFEQQAQRNQSRVEHLAQQSEKRLEGILARVGEVEGQVQSTRKELADAQSELSAQQARVRETAGIGNFAELAASLAELSEQVALLDEQLREIRERTAGPLGYDTPQADARRIETIQRVATAQAQAVGVAPAEAAMALPVPAADGASQPDAAHPGGEEATTNTVYLQFAGVSREVAGTISAGLAPLGFEVPGEERIKTAAGLHEVRYFFESDRARAQQLADATNQILREQGYRAEVTVSDLTGFAGQKPRPGTLELWLEPVRG